MTWSMASLARLFAALTLVIAAFVVVPVSDAAACAPEPVAAHQSFDHDPAGGDHSAPGENGVCAHGHCHHTASERHATSEFGIAEAFVQTRHDRPQDDGVASFAANGLMRPPRS